jgi:hypothetical protein
MTKGKKNSAENFLKSFLDQNGNLLIPCLHKGCFSYWRSLQPSRERPARQRMKFIHFYYIFVDNFCPPGFGSGSTTLIVKYIALNQTDEEKILLSVQEGAEIKTFFFFILARGYKSSKPRTENRVLCEKKSCLKYGAVLEPQGALRNVSIF